MLLLLLPLLLLLLLLNRAGRSGLFVLVSSETYLPLPLSLSTLSIFPPSTTVLPGSGSLLPWAELPDLTLPLPLL